MSAYHPAFRAADAAERAAIAAEESAATVKEILRLMQEGYSLPSMEPIQADPFAGCTLSREGIVANGSGPIGEIDLNRIGVGRNVPSQIFAAISKSKLLGVVSVADLDAFFQSSQMYTAVHFGQACRRLLTDWHAQLEEMLK